MVGFDRGQTLAQRFRVHAGEQTHLYGYVLRGMADDLEAQGPTRGWYAATRRHRPGP